LLVVLTGMVPLAGFMANLVAVPMVSAVVVPLTLTGGLLVPVWPAAGAGCFGLADAVLEALFAVLEWCAAAPLVVTEPGALVAGFAVCAGGLWLFEVSGGRRVLLLLCMGSALLPILPGIEPGEFRVVALDVGQGDAIMVDTARHRLLFDTGPAFPGGFETGSAVVVPSILATGKAAIDVLVLSHADLDHVGGAVAVSRALRVRRSYASFDSPGAMPCRSQTWTWDGVRFRFLEVPRPPPDDGAAGGNDDSCVLLVDDGHRRALLAGDVGARVERALLRSMPGRVDLLFAPHHGSRSSSSRAFLRFTRPEWVFVSAGRDNRYGHPHPEVRERYVALGANVRETARAGALTWRSGAPGLTAGQRDGRIPYWRGYAAATGGPSSR
jgi:competence protein ComEC